MRRPNLDQILLGTALTAALGSLAVYGWSGPGLHHRRSHRAVAGEVKVSPSYVPSGIETPAAGPVRWLPPGEQSRGPEWTYDIFTPPEISYDSRTGRFTVTPPLSPAGSIGLPPGASLELVAVQREPCDLQLLGFVGSDGHFLGTFENLRTKEVNWAGAGRTVPELGLRILDFSVERRPVKMGEDSVSHQRVATAVVRDDRTGETTTLRTGEVSYTDELRAILAATEDDDEALQSLRRGEEYSGMGQTYILDRLQLEPPIAELTQVSPGTSQPIRVCLTPKLRAEPSTATPAD